MDIKNECLEDLFTAINIVAESDHKEVKRIILSLEKIEEFCTRWWEV
jgi:hypothetical protein